MQEALNETAFEQADNNREYTYIGLLQTPRYSWYHPFLVLLLGLIVFLLCSTFVSWLIIRLFHIDSHNLLKISEGSFDIYQPGNAALLLTGVACMIPALFVAHYAVFRKSPAYFFSVQKKFRLRWFVCSLACSLIFLFAVPLFIFFLGPDKSSFSLRPDFPLFLTLIIFLLPLQTAAEELVFRGALPQYITRFFLPYLQEKPEGEVFVALSAAIVSSLLFVLAHASTELWVCMQIAFFGICSFILAYKTGGLESSIAFHTAVNFSTFFMAAISGADAQILAQTVKIGVGEFAMTALWYTLLTAVLLRIFAVLKRRGSLSDKTKEFVISASSQARLDLQTLPSHPEK